MEERGCCWRERKGKRLLKAGEVLGSGPGLYEEDKGRATGGVRKRHEPRAEQNEGGQRVKRGRTNREDVAQADRASF